MNIDKLKKLIDSKLSKLVFVFLLLQPVLDVVSYFMLERGSNTISMLLRFAVLAVVVFVGFLVSERKRIYFIFYGIIAVFWILHMLNCFRIGYQSVYNDTANFLRVISLPMYTLSFITFFKQGQGVRKSIYTGFAANMGLVILFTAVPWLIGQPVYTYEQLEIGLMGWFSVRNAQSAIVALLTPLTLLFAYKTKMVSVFIIASLLTFTLMFLTGTKLAYYSIFLIALGFIVVLLLNLKLKAWPFVATLALLMAATALLKSYAPMQIRETMTAHSQNIYEQLVSETMTASGAEDDTVTGTDEDDDTEPFEPELYQIRKSLIGVYTDKAVYGIIFKDINDRFGVYNVMKAYDYTYQTSILSDSRERKSIFAKLIWEEKDIFTRLFGFEYNDMLHGDSIYDLENDFPAVFYFCGYIGFGLYMLFFLYFVFIIIRAFFRDMKNFLTIEMGAVGMTFILAIGAAQISGNVLRRPNVTAYFAIIAAYLYHLTVNRLPEQKPRLKRQKKPSDV